VKSQQPLPPGRRYTKTDLRRGKVKPTPPPTRPTQVAADEQAALFGEIQPQNQIPPHSSADRGRDK
jgi:hypothetical protein